MGIRADFALQTRADGLVFPLNDPNTRNGLRSFCQMWIYLVLRGEARKGAKDIADFSLMLARCKIVPGLFKRSPHDVMQITHDDMIPIATASFLMDTTHARFLLIYGKQRRGFVRWLYNSENPGVFRWKAWFGRMPMLATHFMFCAGDMPPLWRRFVWALVVSLSGAFGQQSQDGAVLTWMMVLAAKGKSTLCDHAIEIWEARFRKQYPGGIREVMTKYLANNPNDALAKYAPA